MAPDADKLRQRKTLEREAQEHANGHVETRLSAMKGLTTTEVCIDGLIYDITSFHHPGGDQILAFGGNDVTIQYKMIHPYHTDKHLEKMKCVGKVTDFVSEYVGSLFWPREGAGGDAHTADRVELRSLLTAFVLLLLLVM